MSQDHITPSLIARPESTIQGERTGGTMVAGTWIPDSDLNNFVYENEIPIKIHEANDTAADFSGIYGSFACVSSSLLIHYGLLRPRKKIRSLELKSGDEKKDYAYTVTERFTVGGSSFYKTAPHGKSHEKTAAGLFGSIMAESEDGQVGAYFNNGKGKGFYPALNNLLNTVGKELHVYTGTNGKIIYFPVRIEMQRSLKNNNPVIAVGTFDTKVQKAVLVFDIIMIDNTMHYCTVDPTTLIGIEDDGAPIDYYTHHEMNIQYLVMARAIHESTLNG